MEIEELLTKQSLWYLLNDEIFNNHCQDSSNFAKKWQEKCIRT